MLRSPWVRFVTLSFMRSPRPCLRPDAFRRLFDANGYAGLAPSSALADDEDVLGADPARVRRRSTLINLNNGGVSPAPTHVLEAMIRDLRFSNELPVEHMWRVLEPRIEVVRRDLAREFGCDPEEMAITRNASEANEIMIFGLDLKRGDEVIVTNQNYGAHDHDVGAARASRRHRASSRSRSRCRRRATQYIVDQFRDAITPRTRVIEITHITNLTGSDPAGARRSCAWRARRASRCSSTARTRSRTSRSRATSSDVDYYGTSLHKWLLAPIGTGFLYVRRDKIKSLWPMMAAPPEMDEQHPQVRGDRHASGGEPQRDRGWPSRSIAASGWSARSRGCATCATAGPSGCWRRAIAMHVLTPLDDKQSCGIAMLNIDGIDTPKLQQCLWTSTRSSLWRLCIPSSTDCGSRRASTRCSTRSICSQISC